MAVDEFALTDVATLSMYLDSPDRAGIDIYHDESSSATAATVEVTATTLELVITGGGNAGTSSLPLAAAALDTMGELVNVINDLAIGWVASLSGNPDAISDDLVIVAAASAFGSANSQTLNIRDVAMMEHVIDAASGAIERWLDRKVLTRSYTEWVHGQGGQKIILRERPVTALNRIAIGRRMCMTVKNTNDLPTTRALVSVTSTAVVCKRVTSGTETTDGTSTFASNASITAMVATIDALGNGWDAEVQDSLGDYPSADLAPKGGSFCLDSQVGLEIPAQEISDYRFDEDHGIVFLGTHIGHHDWMYSTGVFGRGKLNVFLDYTAGWTTSDIEYKTIKAIATELAAKLYGKAGTDESLVAEKLGDYSYKRSEKGADEALTEFHDRLYPFMQHSVLVGA